jgi:thienamycin biosynthesis protein ThnN
MNDSVNQRLRHVLDIHFDHNTGSPYWLEKQKHLDLDVRKEILTIDDLPRLGAMDENALANRPIEDFIPRRFSNCTEYFIAETAGTLGRPKTTVHRHDEFHSAFIEPFIKAAERCNFPTGGHWLFIGPTGPHIIGHAAQACARAMGSGDIFRVDFDPRWAKALLPGSFAANRYLRHIERQAQDILEVQNIVVIFSTPAVLENLSENLTSEHRQKILGIHLGGMAAGNEFMLKIADSFPKAVILSGYGNTLFGMMPQLHYDSRTGFEYFPFGNRLVAQVIQEPEDTFKVNLAKTAEYEQRGRIVMHRLDDFQLILNMVERDMAIRIPPPQQSKGNGFILDGIRDPRPIVNEVTKVSLGLY